MDTTQLNILRTTLYFGIEDAHQALLRIEDHLSDETLTEKARKLRRAQQAMLGMMKRDDEDVPLDLDVLLKMARDLTDLGDGDFETMVGCLEHTTKPAVIGEDYYFDSAAESAWKALDEARNQLFDSLEAYDGEVDKRTVSQVEADLLRRQVTACKQSLEVMVKALDAADDPTRPNGAPITISGEGWSRISAAYHEQLRLLRILKG